MEEGRYRDGHQKPDYVRDGGRNRGHGRRGGGGGRVRGGGLGGGGGGRSEKRGKFLMDVCPQHLRFTQDSIGIKFKPPYEDLYIDDAVQQIRKKVLSPAQFPPLNVVKHNGILWSLDNRRLWVFRKAGVEGISVNLVPRNFSPRSSEFFTNLTADLEKIYSNPIYYPRVRGRLGNLSYPDRLNVVKITGAGASLPSLPTRSPQQKVICKSTASDHSGFTDDAAEDSSYLRLLELEKEKILHRNLSRPDRVNGTENTGAANASLFPKLSPDPKVMPSVSVVPNPKTHHHIINIRGPNPDAYVPLPSSEKEAVSENVVIRFMKKLFYALRCGTIKVCCGVILTCMTGSKEEDGFPGF